MKNSMGLGVRFLSKLQAKVTLFQRSLPQGICAHSFKTHSSETLFRDPVLRSTKEGVFESVSKENVSENRKTRKMSVSKKCARRKE